MAPSRRRSLFSFGGRWPRTRSARTRWRQKYAGCRVALLLLPPVTAVWLRLHHSGDLLPALARGYIDDPAVFAGFGRCRAAAALSTLAAARFGQRWAPRRLWTGASGVLVAGVLALWFAQRCDLAGAAICVGGTFMVITMAGIKEVLRVGGPQASRVSA